MISSGSTSAPFCDHCSLLREAGDFLSNPDHDELDKPTKALLHIAIWIRNLEVYTPEIKGEVLCLRKRRIFEKRVTKVSEIKEGLAKQIINFAKNFFFPSYLDQFKQDPRMRIEWLFADLSRKCQVQNPLSRWLRIDMDAFVPYDVATTWGDLKGFNGPRVSSLRGLDRNATILKLHSLITDKKVADISLTKEQIEELTDELLQELDTELMQTSNEDDSQSYVKKQVEEFTQEQLKELTKGQLRKFSRETLQEVTREGLIGFSREFLEGTADQKCQELQKLIDSQAAYDQKFTRHIMGSLDKLSVYSTLLTCSTSISYEKLAGVVRIQGKGTSSFQITALTHK